jgi:predicted AlkP superfamily phosphohydrolase/phosphomutase
MAMKAPKVMMIALDAADQEILNVWAGQGLLPTWARLQATGLTGMTETAVGFYVGAIWPCFYTGVNPARHGHHCWEQIEPGSYEVRRYLAGNHVTHEPFWDVFSRAGVTSSIIDVPLSGPARQLKGRQIIEWGCHDPDLGFVTVPPTWAAELQAAHGLHPVQGNCNHPGRTADDYVQFRDDLVRGVALKTQLNEDVLRRYACDLFLTVYSESHCVGHQCWHLHQPGHERYDSAVVQRTGDPVLAVYQALDQGLARLLALAGPETTVIVWASHGMAAHNDGTFMLDEILLRLDMSQRFASGEWRLSALERFWPKRGAARRAVLRQTLDTPHRRFFPHPNNREEAGIRINVAGREPAGFVQPGADYDRVCAELMRDLLELTDVKTGVRIVRNVLKTQDHYRGDYIQHLPDLVVQWNGDFPVRSARSEKIGQIAGPCPCVRSGGHRPVGQFTVLGPGINPGRIARPINVMDFAPTLAALLGIKLDDVDGSVIREIVSIT